MLLLCEVLLLLGAAFDAGDTKVIFPFEVGGRRGVWAWATTVWVAVGIVVAVWKQELAVGCRARVMCFFPGPASSSGPNGRPRRSPFPS